MSFFEGFEKAAASLIGRAKNIQPGLKAYEKPGVIAPPRTEKPGQSIAPRSTPPPLGTYGEQSPWHNLSPTLPTKSTPPMKPTKPGVVR